MEEKEYEVILQSSIEIDSEPYKVVIIEKDGVAELVEEERVTVYEKDGKLMCKFKKIGG